MAKQNKNSAAVKAASPSLAGKLKPNKDYIVYWKSGLKSFVNGGRFARALEFYLQRARLILDAETREPIYEG